jgi:hypothetical protein
MTKAKRRPFPNKGECQALISTFHALFKSNKSLKIAQIIIFARAKPVISAEETAVSKEEKGGG